ncbi:TetR/AcrR family transcriptional regulator [Myxococcus sp. K15C18031901]|uniref:TetR/AcrR family transcriptional regulator n=1 Tax=Myxococcus dinghuensis TaxID=2906761 RepID=UPI0020A73E5D|nr:TetR/AcrR family transcriptional regulator [Myxococcus dinghuensis]MCP3100799.1 TetR/AcrR family transcriptional regulator [Myxococcus dinghuensis]
MARPVSIRDEDILDAAREVFLAHGIRATSAMVAERARVSEGIIFRRFKTKDGLFRAALDLDLVDPPEIADLEQRVGQGTVVDNLHDAGVALVGILRLLVPLNVLALSNPSRSGPIGSRARPNPREAYSSILANYTRGEVALGRLRDVDPDLFACAFIGGINDYVVGQTFRADTTPLRALTVPAFIRALLDLLMRGAQLTPEPPRRR